MSLHDCCLGTVYSMVFSLFAVTVLPWFAHVDTLHTIGHHENHTHLYDFE